MELNTIALIIGAILLFILWSLMSCRSGLKQRKAWRSYKGKDIHYSIKYKIHKTWTEDGYLLKIIHLRDEDKHIEGLNPVIMHHNLGGSAENWLFQGKRKSPAAILALQG